jgi:hypothetical protein
MSKTTPDPWFSSAFSSAFGIAENGVPVGLGDVDRSVNVIVTNRVLLGVLAQINRLFAQGEYRVVLDGVVLVHSLRVNQMPPPQPDATAAVTELIVSNDAVGSVVERDAYVGIVDDILLRPPPPDEVIQVDRLVVDMRNDAALVN